MPRAALMTARETAFTEDKRWFLIHRIHSLIHDLLELDPQDLEAAELEKAGRPLNPGVSGEGDSS